MQELTTRNFGLVIAYVVPGFVCLAGLSEHSTGIYSWFGMSTASAPTVGGFLYLTLGCIGTGLLLSTARWLLVDFAHHRSGIPEPQLDFGRLQDCLPAYSLIVDHHYAYYKFYGNTLVALVVLSVWQVTNGSGNPRTVAVILLNMPLLYLGSRDTLRKYYTRAHQLLEAQVRPIPAKKSDSETS